MMSKRRTVSHRPNLLESTKRVVALIFSGILRANARRRLTAYDRKHRRRIPATPPKSIDVEQTFDQFITGFGGQKTSQLIRNQDSMPENADYFFSEQNVVAELKTLKGVYSGDNGLKQLMNTLSDNGVTGSEMMGVFWRGEPMPEKVTQTIQKRARRAIEQRIKKARRQIRQTKSMFGDSATQSLILFAVDEQPLFGHAFILSTIAKVMEDNYSDEFTDGIVYLNPNVPTRHQPDGMDYAGWFPFYRDKQVNEELSGFVDSLGSAWLDFYADIIGEKNPILKMSGREDVFAVLDSRH